MAISKIQIIPEMLKACPELQEEWDQYTAWKKDQASGAQYFSGAMLYLHIGNRLAEGDTEFFPRFFDFVERLIIEGGPEAKALVVDGFLKGLHKSNSFSKKPGPEGFAMWMRPETKRFWHLLVETKLANDRLKDIEEEDTRQRSVYFRLMPARLWGDYGSMLMSGMAARDMESGELLLERAGPFAPLIFFPNERSSGRCAVVTQSFREVLEDAGLGQLAFRPAVKHHIVDIPWHTWDRLAKFPGKMPKSGEPENFIEGSEHSTKAAEEMEELWELLPPGFACGVVHEESEGTALTSIRRFILSNDSDRHRGLFSPRDNPHLFLVDESTRLWFEEHAGEWVRFDYVVRG